MKRLLLLLLLLLACPLVVFGQGGVGYHDTAWKYTSGGTWPASGATITVCPSTSSGVPCAPVATVYSDKALTTPCIGATIGCLTTDSRGNFSFFTAAGDYIYTVTGTGITSYGPIPFTLGMSFALNNTFTGINTFGNINNVCWIDGTKYTTIASANADAACNTIIVPAATGGAVYAETLSAPLTFGTGKRGLIFLGAASISMGTNSISVAAGLDGFFIWAPLIQGGTPIRTSGVRFIYTGTGTALVLGSASARTYWLNNVGYMVDISGAGSAAKGIVGFRAFNWNFDEVSVVGQGGATGTQVGITIDGSAEFADLVNFHNVRSINVQIAGDMNTTNGFIFEGGASEWNPGSTANSTVALYLHGNGGTTFVNWVDTETAAIGFRIASSNNHIWARLEQNTNCVQFDSGAQQNEVHASHPVCSFIDNSGNTSNFVNAAYGQSFSGGAGDTLFTPAHNGVGGYFHSNAVLGSGTGKNYGVIGISKAQTDAVGDRAYGGWFASTFSTNSSSAVGLHAQSEGTVAGEFGSSAGMKTLINGDGHLTVAGGILTAAPPTGNTGFQHGRVASCTTGAAAGSTCTTTFTWTAAFADANYTASCTIDNPTAVPYVLNTSSKVGASVVVTIANLTAVAASGTLNCIGVHD